MRGIRRIGPLSLIALVLLTAAPAVQAQGKAATATITQVTGRVQTLRLGQTNWAPATVGAQLGERDEIRALAGGSAVLRVPDGSTLVLAENSRLVITKLEVDAQRQTRNGIFHLVVGKVRAVVAEAALVLVATRQSNFAITTPTAVAAARGTDYVVVFNLAQASTAEATLKGEVLCYDLLTRIEVVVPLKRRTIQCAPTFEFSPSDEQSYISPNNPFTGQPSDAPTPVGSLVSPGLVDQILAGQPPLAALGGGAPMFPSLQPPSGPGGGVPQGPQGFPSTGPPSGPPSGPPPGPPGGGTAGPPGPPSGPAVVPPSGSKP